jgi:maltose O-acetyltransferase
MKLIFYLHTRIINLYWKLVYLKIRKTYKISESFRFNGKEIEFYGEGEIIAGENSYIGSYSTVLAAKNCKVVIGRSCMISHNVRVYTTSLIPDQDFSQSILKEKKADVIIGDYVWIGANVFINPGITIRNNSIIGANSVVVKDVLENEIVGGVPAKLIRKKQIV